MALALVLRSKSRLRYSLNSKMRTLALSPTASQLRGHGLDQFAVLEPAAGRADKFDLGAFGPASFNSALALSGS